MKKKIYIILVVLIGLTFVTACSSTTEPINTQTIEVNSITTNNDISISVYDTTNIETTVVSSNETYPLNIEIDNSLKSELISLIDCYFHIKDLFGGRYCYGTGHCVTRDLSEEYSSDIYLYNTDIEYCEFNTDENFYSLYETFFFRNDKMPSFSSSEITQKDYEQIALLYLTSNFYSKNFIGIFNDIVDNDNYVTPSKYWYCNGKLLIYSNSDYMYGGINNYDYFTVNDYTDNSITVTVIREYTEGDSNVQFSFAMEDEMWKISDICYLN